MQFRFFRLLEHEIRFKKRANPKNKQKYACWQRDALLKAMWDKKVPSAVLGCEYFFSKTGGRGSDLFGLPVSFRKKKVRKFKINRAIG